MKETEAGITIINYDLSVTPTLILPLEGGGNIFLTLSYTRVAKF